MAVFIAQLKQYQIDVVADVRSVPYSKVFHGYHQEAIKVELKRNDITYVYLGAELGPRSKLPEHYDEHEHGQVQFDRLMQSPLFAEGVERLYAGMEKGFTIAMMCAEKDPATCHRSLLIGYFLARHRQSDQGAALDILHIDHAGQIEKQTALEQRFCDIHALETDLFMSAEERATRAYQQQLKNTSYRKPNVSE